ncbi:MAG: sterol desaturase family protein [Planctomycetota bacterium]|nr:sterol desaturase family protein [Planctomycetota bacterium]
MDYLPWLLGISLFFALAERLRPERRSQPLVRPQLANDLFYLVFNGHLYALLVGGVIGWIVLRAEGVLSALSILPENRLMDGWPFAAQLVVYLLVSDFLQWSVHILLHRVPLLWQFHKVHHSVKVMDWAANFRFHWMELVVYRSLLYVPLLYLGGGGEALFVVAVFATSWGHFNHSNVSVELGPLGYVMNSPRMHMWHHDTSDEGGVFKNFGIVLSLWDWLFGTAFWPRDRAPERLGYPGDEDMPADLPRQVLFPLARRRG